MIPGPVDDSLFVEDSDHLPPFTRNEILLFRGPEDDHEKAAFLRRPRSCQSN